MDKRFFSMIAVIVVVFLGFVFFNRDDASAPTRDSSSRAAPTKHVKGENAKRVSLVEYGDFQCQVCAIYEPTVQEVFKKYQKDIQFQYRHFPIQSIHENALAGSRAAEAAGQQGKFWEMHDLLYANQSAWARSATPQTFYDQYAQSLELDVAKYKSDFAGSKVNDAINADLAAGTKLDVTGTPAFFIDGKLIELKDLVGDDGRPTLEKFSQVIDKAIAAKQ